MSRDDLLALAEQLELPDDLVDGHLTFDPDTYARNLILRTPGFELLALCWQPGQRSTIHDHGGSVGVVRVYEGDLTSRLYGAPDDEPARLISEDVVGPGTHAAVDRPDIHQLANETGKDLVTIHFYSPPLAALGVYRTDSPERERLRLRYTLHEDLG
jgi:cysteine dioxygenase